MLKKIFRFYDYSIILAVAALCAVGLLMIYSASMITTVVQFGVESDYFFDKQKKSLLFSAIICLVAMLFPYKLYPKLIKFIVIINVIVLGLVFIVGHTAGNAQSWLKFGSTGFQPAEFAKLTVIIYLASVLSKRQKNINDLKQTFIGPIGLTFFIFLIVAVQPDFGTAAIIAMIAAVVMLCSGINFKTIGRLVLLAIACVAIMLPIAYWTGYMSEERLSRFTGASNPFKYAEDEGYQLVNSYIAIGAGGLKGLGLGEGIQKYGYLPESHTDFIMAVIAEELGFLGVIIVLSLLIFLILRILLLSKRCQDPFGSLICIGIASMIGIQSLINLGGLTGMIPITGVPLPFISYGGSSLLLLMSSIGIVINISFFVNYQEVRQSKKSPIQKSNETISFD
ncbi:FtsW/RodA/SpoVE family cell cycle protein [Metabacillus iocasae]|uniref:Probable peptidoglycan glycosyltransferase FtsW n=1 Tax=Priestia iocasae TaxID=2291674 RepID=A0ABS2QWI7_9BACI|nr:FtsW/RodA/SpoVE family cell cycle protein [Metabacillus iocasae]MBM7703357.1 cell division protein FtsW [Metabacillus iocasae]